MSDVPSKRGAMYRPATEDTYRRIQEVMAEHEISWNSAVNLLVRAGLQSLDRPARNQRRFQ